MWTKEVGPWNENDNYWDSASASAYNPRRCSPSPGTDDDYIPEAYLAWYYNFNGGYSCILYSTGGDQYVLNQAGVDLEPDLAAMLGIGYYENVWVYVKFVRLP